MLNKRKKITKDISISQSGSLPVSATFSSRISSLASDALLIISFSFLITVCARTGIYEHFPFQSEIAFVDAFAVLLAGGMLGSRRGLLATLVYLVAGAIGLPVFPAYQHVTSLIPNFLYFFGGKGGIAYPGGLYAWSYPLAAFVVGWLCERNFKYKFLSTLGALLAGSLILTLFAVASSVFITHAELSDALQDALSYGPGDFLLLMLVAGILQLRKR